jgi:hypothetical protein
MWKTRSKKVWWRAWPPLATPRSRPEWAYFLAYQLLRLGLGGLFVYAGFIKLMDPKAFAHSLAQFDLLPEPLLPLVAVGLPGIEVLAGGGLIFEVRGSLGAVLVLLGVFLLALGYAVLMEMDLDCGCFTVAELTAQTDVKQAFFRDVGLVAVAAFLFWRRRVLDPLARLTRKAVH